MFRWLHDRIKLYRLNRQEKKLDKEAKRVRKESQEKKDHGIYAEWESSYARYEYEDIEWARKQIESDSLLRDADELHLPRPEYGEKGKWDEDRPIMETSHVADARSDG